MAHQIPEISDGGYWYVTVSATDETGALSPSVVPGAGWCAWYGEIDGVLYVVIRTPEPLGDIEAMPVTVDAVLEATGHSGKPRGRIGGS